jgi:DNA-binding transcriptional regulator LsrR (DeoR family)
MQRMMTIDEYCAINPGVSQDEIARDLGISRPYLNQILNHTREPGGRTMMRIMVMTGGVVSMDSWAMRRRPPPPPPPPPEVEP